MYKYALNVIGIMTIVLLSFFLTDENVMAKDELKVKHFETYEELQDFYKNSKDLSIYLQNPSSSIMQAADYDPLTYHFGNTSFSNYVYVGGGRSFY
ncbi:hypothetical protein JCM21714_2249 [Gracilibacillus boraciitolerans JCM 21714]|uniref:Uncharacterized protein n=1 Tax=Gracilibacillus boraciitolerans JCM 21714 TaxID=1298598 RepID=W4VIF6_9BACI|nr:hypothetical protein [Gracilibacillus boraciitolerans]GAE93195.1 hypothetical protein JCM21714_2249 [Gracilibacillus boraciitolerans JCM 21714]